MNSLIGKWAAHGRAWTDAPGEALLSPWHHCHKWDSKSRVLKHYRSIGWHVQRLDESEETGESCPALAAWTYSVGRCRLQQWIDTAGKEDVVYVDSDSLYCVRGAGDRLVAAGMVRPGELGALRVQGVYPTLRIGGIRDYAAGGRTVRAGLPPSAERAGSGSCVYWCAETVREAVDQERRPEPEARLVTIPEYRAYRHGTVDATGRVHPLNVGVMGDD